MFKPYPRLMIAGFGGDSGKTFLSISLLKSWQKAGIPVAAFKKGPDYIDAAWLQWASGSPARNLDTYMMGTSTTRKTFIKHGFPDSINLIEGNRGLYDGLDAQGTHSSAELAKLLNVPVILIISVSKVTRTVAALVLGCQKMDLGLNIAGVVLNRVANTRQETTIKKSIQMICGIPVLGTIPSLDKSDILPGRHLGLITPEEHEGIDALETHCIDMIKRYVDSNEIKKIAMNVDPINLEPEIVTERYSMLQKPVKVGVFRDSAFTFYYPENLELLEQAGASIVKISPLADAKLPDLDVLYIGGGFPETHAYLLSQNRSMLWSVKEKADNGLPVYAECGGLIYLAKILRWNNVDFPMSGALPITVKMEEKPQGHGYCELKVIKKNPFFPINRKLHGHEFHYSRIISGAEDVEYAFQLNRGTGSNNKKDGIIYKNILANYVHLHASGVSDWGMAFINAPRQCHRGNPFGEKIHVGYS